MAPSLPAWECGLKFETVKGTSNYNQSLPAWECGLKFVDKDTVGQYIGVTPCVGVWIEITKFLHLLQGRS